MTATYENAGRPAGATSVRSWGFSSRLDLRLLLGVLLACATPLLRAQNHLDENVTVLRTGEGVPLATVSRNFFVSAETVAPIITFAFGFATEETIRPDFFFDSFTGTLQARENPALTAVLFTIDTSGLLIRPPTPGGIELPPSSLGITPVPFPALEPVLPSRSAFTMTFAVPNDLRGRELTLFFDLFDNQDSRRSLGWVSEVVMVPEPSAAFLLLAGLGIWSLLHFNARRRPGNRPCQGGPY